MNLHGIMNLFENKNKILIYIIKKNQYILNTLQHKTESFKPSLKLQGMSPILFSVIS